MPPTTTWIVTYSPNSALERYKKDFASFDREQRNQEMTKKQMDIERKRLEYLER